ncbi:unnamed protein product, partial [Darwinula stevensoni]
MPITEGNEIVKCEGADGSKKLEYGGKVILAPMVRIGTLPMRLLALQYGADIVYSEELIDWKLLRSRRVENQILGTVDYVDETDGTVIFRTHPKLERHQVVLQVGTSDPQRALQVAKKMEGDVDGIDINMGCPKEFSLKGGMGAALLYKPDTVKEILETLVKNIPRKAISCKIRVLEDLEDTLALCRIIENTGVVALAIHGRTKKERPQYPNRNDVISRISQQLKIPIIANGGSKEIKCFEDIEKFREVCGTSSVMLARAAMWNCSIFRKDGMLPLHDVIRDYLRLCVDFDSQATNVKYVIQNMIGELQSETSWGRTFLGAQTLEEICAVWELDEYWKEKQKEFGAQLHQGSVAGAMAEMGSCRNRVIEMPATFLRKHYKDTELPNCRKSWDQPIYETRQEEKIFRSIVTLNGMKFTSLPGIDANAFDPKGPLQHHEADEPSRPC